MRRVRSEIVVPVPIGVEASLNRALSKRQNSPSPPVLQCSELPFHLGVKLPATDTAEDMRCSKRSHCILKLPPELCATIGDEESRRLPHFPNGTFHKPEHVARCRCASERLQSQQFA